MTMGCKCTHKGQRPCVKITEIRSVSCIRSY
nr:MAG TPA_asm: hypothetical protein [Bacteriophage sp.]